MRLGLFGARADDRGLGRLTHDFYTHMRPARTLVVDMGPHAHRFTQHLDRYPDATVVPFNGGIIAPDVMRKFFTGLDVAIMYETAYDHRAYTFARDAGCRTVLYSMPEFHRHTKSRLPSPDAFWVPTTWRLGTFPPGTQVMPAPVAARPGAATSSNQGLRLLHVAGHRTSGDRNGTVAFDRALRSAKFPMSVRVTSQGRLAPLFTRLPTAVRVDVGMPADHWGLYAGSDVLVMPRRYGGLCLPVQEAMGAGLGVVMTDCEPNPATWPICPVRYTSGKMLRTPGGTVVLHDPVIADLTAVLGRLSGDRAEVEQLQARSRSWAAANSWEALEPRWRAALEAVAPAPMSMVQSSRPRSLHSQRRA